MEYYVGLDVSLKQTSICVVDQMGAVVREGVVDSDPEAISVYVRSKAPGAVRIGLHDRPRLPTCMTHIRIRASLGGNIPRMSKFLSGPREAVCLSQTDVWL